MPVVVVIESNLNHVADRLEAMQVAIPGAAAAASRATAELIKGVATEAIRDHTPVDSGELRDSTTREITPTGASGQIITIRQTKTVDWVKGGGAYPLAKLLIYGHGAYTIVPTNKQALFWPGADHPVRSVNMPAVAPNDYPTEAMDEARAPIAIVLSESAHAMIASITDVLGAGL